MSETHYAIEIDVDVALTNPTYGLYNGMLTYVTDRPGYDGTPTYPKNEDGSDNTNVYHEGWITKEGFGSPNRNIDITVSGEYGTLSGFSFSVRNDTSLWDYLKDNSIYLINRPIRAYVVIDDIFYVIWSGIIASTPRSETSQLFNCVDSFKTIHKQIPPNFTQVGSENPTPVPITFGDVDYAKLVDSGEVSEWQKLWSKDGIDYDRTASYYTYNSPRMDGKEPGFSFKLWLHCPGDYKVPFGAFVGMYAFITAGAHADETRGYRILYNSSPAWVKYAGHNKMPASTSGAGVRCILLELAISPRDYEDGGPTSPVNSLPRIDGQAGTFAFSADTSLWRIAKVTLRGIVSDGDVGSIVLNSENNLPSVYTFDTQAQAYSPIQPSLVSYSDTTANVVGHPYIEVASGKSGKSTFMNTFAIRPKIKSMTVFGTSHAFDLTEQEWQSFGTGSTAYGLKTYPGVSKTNAMLSPLIDMDRDTYFTCDPLGVDIKYLTVKLQCDISDAMDKDVEELHFGIDWFMTNLDAIPGRKYYAIAITFRMRDLFGNVISDIGGDIKFTGAGPQTSGDIGYFDFYDSGDHNKAYMLPSEYYNFGGNDSGSGDYFSQLSNEGWSRVPDDVFGYIRDGISSSNVEVWLQIFAAAGGNPINFTSGGDPLGGPSVGLVNATANLNIAQVGFVGIRTANLANGDLYAKVSGELTDSTSANNVYTAFKHILQDYDGIPSTSIDYGNLPTQRDTWYVSRQLTDRKSSADYLAELCRHSFVGMVPTREGHRRLMAWRDSTATPYRHDSTSIVRDSIQSVSDTEQSQLYNQYGLQYAFDPAKNKYRNSLFVNNADATAYPDASSSLWPTYVGVLSQDVYQDTKLLWTACHSSYLIEKAVTPIKDTEYTQLPWYTDSRYFDSTAQVGFGVGSSAFYYLTNLIEWSTRKKKVSTYEVPIDSTSLKIELLDRVVFNDPIYTGGADWTGWVVGVTPVPDKDTITIQAMFEPDGPIDVFKDVNERGIPLNDPDTIDENGSRTTWIDQE